MRINHFVAAKIKYLNQQCQYCKDSSYNNLDCMSLREHKNHVNVNCEKISVDLQEVELDSCTYYLRSIVEV